MRVVRDLPAARHLPSRHYFALSRLLAFINFRLAEKRDIALETDHLLLAVDRGQSTVENYAVSIWFFASLVCYAAAALPFSTAVAIAAAIPLVAIAVELPMWIGLPAAVNSPLLMLAQFSASAYFATTPSPVIYVAWFSLMLFVTNAAAWLIMQALRNQVHEMERRCGI